MKVAQRRAVAKWTFAGLFLLLTVWLAWRWVS